MATTTVLIIDDDPGAAEALGPMLKSHGYEVHVSADAESGLQEVQRSGPLAIVVDLHLPTVDGVEFLHRLRASSRHAHVPVAVGAQLFFKPLWEDDLARIVRGLLGAAPAA
jgi:DNA-binding response OmpR family regulator